MYTNVWYVAARTEELKDKPLYVKMLGSDFVLFRDNEGKPACLSNACPHRGASLANGSCSEDREIICPFHGWQFNGVGTCTRIPAVGDDDPQTDAPGVKIDSYPTIEKQGLIWTFLGDEPDQAKPILDIPELDDPE
jgi:phenylpropionate dioxygenase-like ring-hydroxylating dioxygenase large terminal subunit